MPIVVTLSSEVLQTRHPARPSSTSAIVVYGRDSARIPGISPGRRRGRDGVGGRRRRFSDTRPSRSSFGARLRSRLPQYGHSVMYGLTSEPQLLQTTNRSGLPVLIPWLDSRPAPKTLGRGALPALHPGGGDDLGHDLVQIVVGLVDHHLTGGAVSPLQQILHRGQLIGRAQVLAVLPHPVQEAPGQGPGLDTLGAGEIHQLPLESVPGGQPLVLVQHLERISRELSTGVVVLTQLLDQPL